MGNSPSNNGKPATMRPTSNMGSGTIDESIPKYSYSQAIEPFPETTPVDYPEPATHDASNLRQPLSIQAPFMPSAARTRVHSGVVDLRYELIRHDPLRGEEKSVVGRQAVPSQAPIGFANTQSNAGMRLILAPVAAALATAVVDKNVSAATTHVKVLFPDSVPGEAITLNGRAMIRTLAGKSFAPERYIWRLASMYLAASWTELNGGSLTTAQRDLPTINHIGSVAKFNSILATWDESKQPISVYHEGFADMVAGILPVLMLAGSSQPEYRTTQGIQLPTVAQVWPSMGNTSVCYTGPQLPQNMAIGDITASTVWEAAQLWCGQHGCVQMFMDYVHTIAVLWTSSDANLSPMFQSKRMRIPLPVSNLSPTLLMPIAQSYVTWRDEFTNIDPPSKYDVFLQSASLSMLVGLGIRTYAYKAGMPYVGLIERAETEEQLIFKSFKARGNACPAMFHAQAVIRSVGCTGTLGSTLLGCSPSFNNIGDMGYWWRQHSIAYQWEEVANVLHKLPRCCALAGVVKPLHSTKIPIVGMWYDSDVIVGGRCTEEALQGLFYVPELEIGYQISDGHNGTVSTHTFTRKKNYRNSFSDWQFTPRYSKQFMSATMVFRVTTTRSAIAVHEGPMGTVKWTWYVSRPTVEEDVSYNTITSTASGTPNVVPINLPQPSPGGNMKPNVTPDEPPKPQPTEPGDTEDSCGPRSSKMKQNAGQSIAFLKTALKDAGQPIDWLKQLELGIERISETDTLWQDRDREGRMRAAWDAVEGLDPNATLIAVPNGLRARVAGELSNAYALAAQAGHSITAVNKWVSESVRMKQRAKALATCSAMSRVELEDYTSPGKVQPVFDRMSDESITRALSAGIDAESLLDLSLKGAKDFDSQPADDVVEEAEAETQQTVTDTLEPWMQDIKTAYDGGEIDAPTVEMIIGFLPDWVSAPKPEGEVEQETKESEPPIVDNIEIPIDIEPPATLTAPDSDNNVTNSKGETVTEITSDIADSRPTSVDFGNDTVTTGMSEPMPPQTTSILEDVQPEPGTQTQELDVATPTALAEQLQFTE